jgi:hypothetical protein
MALLNLSVTHALNHLQLYLNSATLLACNSLNRLNDKELVRCEGCPPGYTGDRCEVAPAAYKGLCTGGKLAVRKAADGASGGYSAGVKQCEVTVCYPKRCALCCSTPARRVAVRLPRQSA